MHVILEPFVAEHGVEVTGASARDFLGFFLRCQYEGPGYTGRLPDGRILACAGVVEDTPYSGNAWVLPTPLVKQYPLLFHRTVLTKWQELFTQYGWRRVQGMCDPRCPERIRWLERFGFVKEGVARGAGQDGTDLWYYGWLKENGNGR
jgi:hypothetical protein